MKRRLSGRFGLTVKLPLLVVLVVLLTSAAGGGLAIVIGRNVLRDRALAANADRVQTYASAIGFYLEHARAMLENAAESEVVRDFSSARLVNPVHRGLPPDVDRPKRNVAARILRHSNVFDYVMLLRTDGSVYLLEPYDLQVKQARPDRSFTAWYANVIRSDRTVVSDLHISPATRRPSVVIATPVRDGGGRIQGTLAGALRLGRLSEIGRQSAIGGPTPHSYGYLTDRRGLIVAHQTKTKYVEEQTDFNSVPAVRAALAGQHGTGQWFNPIEDDENLGAYVPLPGIGWPVVYVVPASMAFTAIPTLARSIALTSAALALFFGLIGVALMRRVVRPIRELTSGAGRIGGGDFSQRVPVESTDEIGQLAQEFNRMAAALDQKETQLRQRAEEIHRKNKELETQYRRLQEANRLKSEFLANMSHELRTPLNAIIGFAELMHDGKVGPVSAEHKDFLGDILTSSRHLLQLINDVLDLSKVEAGKMEFRPEAVDLVRVVTEVQDILRTLMAKKRIRVQAEVAPTLTHIVTDPGKLKQVLYNYLSNALKFTPDEGHVTVRILPDGPEAFRLEVEDTGIGIKSEDLGRLFVEFQQLDASTAKKYPGTGLGLALTKRIVEAQGGQVGVRSTPGQGSTFFAILPRVARATPDVEAKVEPTPAMAPQPGAPTILVIEDDAKDRGWLTSTLAGAGYAVEAAATGAEALAKCRERPFDAITLDLLLPDMNGCEVLERVRADGPNRGVPVIVVTVVAERAAVRSFPVHDFLVKPVEAETLLASLARAGITPDGSHKILVVDDDPHALKLMETILTQLGFQPLCQADAESGLRAAAEACPAAIVLDLLMPGMDGFTFLERFRRTAAGRRIPVIVWSVKDLTADERKRLKASAQAVVQKGQGGTAALLEELKAYLPAPRG